MNSRISLSIASCALIIIGLSFLTGCDERNTADLPEVVYTLKKNIVTPGVALHVDARENLLAVAASSAGTFVYDITNAANPTEVFHFEPSGQLYTEYVGLDAINGLVLTVAGPDQVPGDLYPIHDLETGERIGGAAFSGGIVEVEVLSRLNEFVAWRSDRTDGVVPSATCYIPDSARWRSDYCSSFYFGFVPSIVVARGIGFRDSLIAIAMSNYEVRIHNMNSGTTVPRFSTPGDPQDCAWFGSYILVADNFHLTVASVANLDTPVVVKTFTIPGADRLRSIVIDGEYAVLLDDSDGLYVVDVSDPTNPEYVQAIALPEVSSVTAANGRIIASDEQLGVLIYE